MEPNIIFTPVEEPPVVRPQRFTYSLATLMIMVTILAVILAAWAEWGGPIAALAGWAALTVFAFSRRRYALGLMSLGLWGVLAWAAFWSIWGAEDIRSGSVLHHSWHEMQLYYAWSDNPFFDKYKGAICALPQRGYRGGLIRRQPPPLRVRGGSTLQSPAGRIYFPPGESFAVVNVRTEVMFVDIPDECFVHVPISPEDQENWLDFPGMRRENRIRRVLIWDMLVETEVWQDDIEPFLLGEEVAGE